MFGKYGPIIALMVAIIMIVGIYLLDKYYKGRGGINSG